MGQPFVILPLPHGLPDERRIHKPAKSDVGGAEEVTEPGKSAVRQFDKPHRTQFLRFNLREVDRPRDCRGFTSHAMAAQAYADGGLAGFSTLRASVQRIRSLVAGYPTFRSFVHAFGDFCGRFSDFANQIRARRFGN